MNVDVTKYNTLREALARNPEDEHDIIKVGPKIFALKKEHSPEVLQAAMEILQDKRIITGMTPINTVNSLAQHKDQTVELLLYVLACYAVALQQEWIRESKILRKYILNQENAMAKEYVQDIHKTLIH